MLLGVDTSVLTATKSSPRKFAPLTALFVTSAASVFLASSALRDEQFPQPEHRWDLEHLRHSNTRTAAAIPFLGRQQLSRPEVGVGQQQNCSVRSSRLLNSQAPRYPNTPSPARASKVLGVLRVLFAPPKHQVLKALGAAFNLPRPSSSFSLCKLKALSLNIQEILCKHSDLKVLWLFDRLYAQVYLMELFGYPWRSQRFWL